MSFRDGSPVRVEVGAIEAALEELWATDAQQDEPVVRARAATLIFCTRGRREAGAVWPPPPGSLAGLQGTIDQVMRRYPGRVIGLFLGEEAHGPLEAWVSARCHLGLGGHVCGEQVTVAGSGDVTALAGLVAALRPPDLPTFLWWDAPLTRGHDLLHALADKAHEVIVDSGRPDATPGALAHVSALIRQMKEATVSDLSWARAAPWRELVAQFFDPEAATPVLASLDAADLVYRGATGWACAVLLAGWLAAQLRWEPAGSPPGHAPGEAAARRADGAPVRLQLVPGGDGPDGIHAVRLTAGRDAAFAVEFEPATGCAALTTRLPGRGARHRAVSLTPPTEGDLLCAQLAAAARDRIFESAVEAARGLEIPPPG